MQARNSRCDYGLRRCIQECKLRMSCAMLDYGINDWLANCLATTPMERIVAFFLGTST